MKTVKLSARHDAGPASFDAVTFREPRFADYRQLGPVFERQSGVVVVYREVVWSYADRLIHDLNPGALATLPLIDALAIEDAILDFFGEARRLLSERESLSTASVGSPTTSTA